MLVKMVIKQVDSMDPKKGHNEAGWAIAMEISKRVF